MDAFYERKREREVTGIFIWIYKCESLILLLYFYIVFFFFSMEKALDYLRYGRRIVSLLKDKGGDELLFVKVCKTV